LKPESLEKRLKRIQGPEPDSHRFEEGAYTAWIVCHLTDEEQSELCRIFKKLEDSPDWKEREDLLTEGARIQKLAEERASKERPEEYKTKWIRAEALRHTAQNTGRKMTDAEHNELMSLNGWLQAHSHWSLKKHCLVGLGERD